MIRMTSPPTPMFMSENSTVFDDDVAVARSLSRMGTKTRRTSSFNSPRNWLVVRGSSYPQHTIALAREVFGSLSVRMTALSGSMAEI